MAYNEFLADRISQILKEKKIQFTEKKMMGGICYLVDDKMCVGIIKNDLMARLDPDIMDGVLSKPACRAMDFTKRPMKGYVFIDSEGYDLDLDLEYWIDKAYAFNPFAKSSKKR